MHAEEALAQLREAITAPARFEGVDPASALSALHPLACPATGLARREVRGAVASLRTALHVRESWERRPDARDALLHVLRDTAVQRKRLAAGRVALRRCLELARTEDPFASACAATVARIVAAAERAGAATHAEPAPPGKPTVVSVCGSTFLADFHVHARTGAADAKFRDVDAAGAQSAGDRDVDDDFAHLVAAADFTQLERAFRGLVRVEALDAALGPAIPLRRGLAAFEADLLAMQAAEVAAGCPQALRVAAGHGIAKRGAHGLRVAYAPGRSVALSAEDAPEPRHLLLGSSSPALVPGLAAAAAAAAAAAVPRFAFSPHHAELAPAHYVLVLDQPLPVTLKVAQELESIAAPPAAKLKRAAPPGARPQPAQKPKRAREEDPFAGPFPSGAARQGAPGSALAAAASVVRTLPGHVDSFPSIQMLLAPKSFASELGNGQDAGEEEAADAAMPRQGAGGEVGAGAKGEGSSGEAASVAKLTLQARKAPGGRVLSAELNEYVCCVALPNDQHITLSHNVSNLVAGVTISRVPVLEPRNVLTVLSILRQQLAFNELFVSCFGQPGGVSSESTPLVNELVEVVLDNAPEFMHFAIYDTRAEGIVELGISIAKDGTFAAKITAPHRNEHACSDKKATEILMQTRSVPRTIQAFMKMAMDRGSGVYS